MYSNQNAQQGGWGPWGNPEFKNACREKWGRHMRHKFGGMPPWARHFRQGNVPVNIEEKDDRFELSLYAAGLDKQQIKIAVKEDVLTISYTAPQATGSETGFSRREHEQGSFERGFALNGKVLSADISAAYTDGILKVTLPKNPETNTPAQEVNVA